MISQASQFDSSTFALRARLGGPRGMNALLGHCERKLYRYCLRLTRNGASARHLCRHTIARVLEKLPCLHDGNVFWPWVFGLARNLYFAQVSKERALEAEEPAEDSATDLRLRVRSALALLAPEDRAAMLISHVEERSCAELAGALGVSEFAMQSRVRHARAMFLALLKN